MVIACHIHLRHSSAYFDPIQIKMVFSPCLTTKKKKFLVSAVNVIIDTPECFVALTRAVDTPEGNFYLMELGMKGRKDGRHHFFHQLFPTFKLDAGRERRPGFWVSTSSGCGLSMGILEEPCLGIGLGLKSSTQRDQDRQKQQLSTIQLRSTSPRLASPRLRKKGQNYRSGRKCKDR